LGVSAIVLDDAGRILLVQNSYRDGWHLPGGGVKRRETAIDAIRRELAEEIGLKLEAGPDKVLGIFSRFSDGSYDHVVVFIVQAKNFTPVSSDGLEIEAARAFAVSELPTDLGAGTRRRIEEYFDTRKIDFMW
jgi:ADP-ribose pyrophosphatase YjhB (NUDIX family)